MNLSIRFPLGLLLAFALNGAVAQTTIFDVQFVDTSGASDHSPLLGQEVTVSGVVTASGEADNLGAVYMQQPGLTEWAGIQIASGPGLGNLLVGDEISVTAFVGENGGKTVLQFASAITVTGSGTISPVTLDPAIFTNYSLMANEKYESMLVKFHDPAGLVYVVDKNPDAPSNFGEWRVGFDVLSPDSGCRVLTGRATSSTSSSLNVSYVNSLVWANQNGTMNVPAIEVNDGDEFHSIAGIITYHFGQMKLLPRNNADVLVAPDSDGDGVADDMDNCTLVANALQTDADEDGFGNFCDADFNGDCFVNATDLGLFRQAFFGQNAVFDLNSDGVVNTIDLGLMKLLFFAPPGPSGPAGACE